MAVPRDIRLKPELTAKPEGERHDGCYRGQKTKRRAQSRARLHFHPPTRWLEPAAGLAEVLHMLIGTVSVGDVHGGTAFRAAPTVHGGVGHANTVPRLNFKLMPSNAQR